MDSADGFSQKIGDREHAHLSGLLLLVTQWNSVGQDNLFNVRVVDAFNGRPGEYAMGSAGIDGAGAISQWWAQRCHSVLDLTEWPPVPPHPGVAR